MGPVLVDERPGEVVFPGDLDGDRRDDVVWACGDAICGPRGVVADGVLAGSSVTDPRFPPLLASGTTDAEGRALLWVGGALRPLDGRSVARLDLPPAVAGFDADGDGSTDVLSVVPGGRAVLTFGPFAGQVHNDPDTASFDAGRAVVYDTGGDSVAHRVWWIPDAFGAGHGAVAAQCSDDERIGSCPSGRKTVWWPVSTAGSRVGAERASGFPEDAPGGAWLLPVGDLDRDGLADLLVDDGSGGWSRVRGTAERARVGASLGARGPVAALPDGWVALDGRALDVVRDGTTCLRFDLPLVPDRLSVGEGPAGRTVAVTGRIGDRWAVVGVDGALLEGVCGR